MEDFYCDTLALRFPFTLEDIDRDAFKKAISDVPYIDEFNDADDADEEKLDAAVSFGSRDNPTKYHAHLRLRLRKEGGRVDLSYHQSPLEVDDVQPPYLEDCAQWVAGFFKVDKFNAHITSSYIFDDSFSPVIALPFPLVTTEKALGGSLVTGLSLLLPKDESSEMVIIQSSGDDIWISHNATSEVSLKDFDLSTELKRLSATIKSLVKKQGTHNAKSTTQKADE
jgi:hypothetical protein